MGTVKSRISRARLQLAAALRGSPVLFAGAEGNA
jgi:DNA-directed RNA polymerase specialized sigma24 family protein